MLGKTIPPLLAALALVGAIGTAAVAQDACAPPSGPAEPAAVAGGNAALSAPQPGPAPAAAPTECWTGNSGNATLGGRAVAVGDVIATLSDANQVVGFAADGSEQWRVDLGEPGQGLPGGLTAAGDLFIAASPMGLYGLNADDGSVAWEVAINQARVTGSTGATGPASVGDQVYAIANSAGSDASVERWLLAVDAATGQERWRVSVAATLPAGPVSADESTVALWDGNSAIRTFEPDSGDQRWLVDVETLGSAPAGTMTMANGLLVAMLATGELVALDVNDGSEVWRFTPDAPFTAAITMNAGTVYVNAETALYAIAAADGSLVWQADLQSQPSPFEYRPIPALADDLVILGTTEINQHASLIAFDAATGQEQWRTQVSIYGAMLSPIVTGGRVYAPAFDINQAGGLMAFGHG